MRGVAGDVSGCAEVGAEGEGFPSPGRRSAFPGLWPHSQALLKPDRVPNAGGNLGTR